MAQVSSIYDKWFLKNQNFRQKFHILLILTGKNASKWPEWHIFRVWGVPNPMALVSGLYNKQFLWNQNFRQKFHILLILTGKMHQNGLSGMYLGFEVCQIQWHLFQVSTISSSWKIKISGKNFTFCWFWLGKMHHNGLSGMYLGFEVCQIQWHRFQVSTISSCWKIKISGKNFTFCWFWLGKMHHNGLSGTYIRVWGVPNPMAQVSSIYDKWFLKNQNFRQKFHILLILTGKNAS